MKRKLFSFVLAVLGAVTLLLLSVLVSRIVNAIPESGLYVALAVAFSGLCSLLYSCLEQRS